MSSLFAIRALLFAGECLAASALLLSLAWAASLFLKQASMRHFVWLTAFGVLLVFPAVALIVPATIAIEHKAEVAQPVPTYVEYTEVVPASVSVTTDPVPVLAPTPKPHWNITTREIAYALFAVWFAGFAFATMRFGVAMLGLQFLRRRSRPHTLASADLPQTEAAGRECELRLSLSEDGPMAWGIFRPVILLPKNSLSWPRARLQAVLLHELAHIRRRDCLTQLLSLIACAVYWPNPLMWIGAKALRREAEIAADDAVLTAGIKQSTYAGELLQLASEFRGRRALTGVAMAAPSSLEARVKSVLAPDKSRTGVTAMDALKLACLGIAATALLALARPDVVEAQDNNVAPVSAPAELPPPDAVLTVPDAPPAPPAPPAPRHHHMHTMQSAQVDMTAPDAPPAPPAPPPAMHAVPPVPPVAANEDMDDEDANAEVDSDDDTADVKGDKVVKVRVWRDKDGHRHVERSVQLTPADRAEIAHARDEARRATIEMRRVQPEIDKALAAAKVQEKVALAMREVEPRVRAEIAKAMAEARPEIRRAIAEAHISEKVMKALHDAQPKIDAAMRRAEQAQRHIEIEHVERHGDDEAPSAEEDDNGADH